jgi:microcystin degradation protein MlrC
MTAKPRVAAAQISHETNTFSAVPTDLAAFEASGLQTGAAILTGAAGTNSAFGGFLSGAAAHDLSLVPIISVWATPSGLVTSEAIGTLERLLADGLRQAMADGPLAGVVLALHGAMVTADHDDGEGYLLGVVREIVGSDLPIVATIDLHANISQAMVDRADVLIGYDTYPHVDMAERAHEACEIIARLISGEVRPTAALRKPPMLPTSQRMTTDRMPMRALIERAWAMERDPAVLNVTVAGGFPPADVADAGLSVLVTTDADPELAVRLADELAAEAWTHRDGFLGGVASWADAATAIRELRPNDAPLVLVDIGDNPWTGGPGDSAELVRFLLAKRVEGAAVALVNAAETIAAATAAGVGATIEVRLGGKTDRLHGDPLAVRAYVRLLSDGHYVNEGPMMEGVRVALGPTAVLVCRDPDDADGPGVEVLVTTRAETPIALNVFRAHGIEPTQRRVLALKGKGHFRAAFEPIARRVMLVEGPGITGADLSRLTFRKVRRPIWPLDPI